MSINVHYSFDLTIVPGIATAETFNFFSIWNSKFYTRKKTEGEEMEKKTTQKCS